MDQPSGIMLSEFIYRGKHIQKDHSRIENIKKHAKGIN